MRAAKDAFAAEDYDAAMKTGVVLRKHRSIRDGKDSRVVIEYEINTALIECLNSVEKRAAIETGQEVDRQDIKLRGGMNDQAEVLKRTFTFEELNQMQLRMQATIEAERSGKVVEAKAIPEDTHTSGEREGDVTPSQAPTASRSWRD